MFYATPNDHARQTRRIRELTATVTDLLLRQGRLLDRIYELTYQVDRLTLQRERFVRRACKYRKQAHTWRGRAEILLDALQAKRAQAEAAEARVRELEAAIKDIYALATECPQPLPSNFYAGRGVQEWVNAIYAIAESALEDSND
jgi:chromosome segregation ATPase